MRSSNHSNIHPHRLVVANALQLSTLQKAQHLGLQRHRHLANLVEKQCPAVRRFNPPGARLHRPGKRSARMAEQLRLQQRLRDRRAVQHRKRPRRSQAQAVQRPRHHLLAGARLALDQHRSRSRSHHANQPRQLLHHAAGPYQLRQHPRRTLAQSRRHSAARQSLPTLSRRRCNSPRSSRIRIAQQPVRYRRSRPSRRALTLLLNPFQSRVRGRDT